jgi:hypothetical protein
MNQETLRATERIDFEVPHQAGRLEPSLKGLDGLKSCVHVTAQD